MLLKIKTKTRARKAIKSKIQPFKNNNNKINVKLQPRAYPMLSLVVVRISVSYLKKFFNKNVAKTIEIFLLLLLIFPLFFAQALLNLYQ